MLAETPGFISLGVYSLVLQPYSQVLGCMVQNTKVTEYALAYGDEGGGGGVT